MPYYIKCEYCDTLICDAGAKIHICSECREKRRTESPTARDECQQTEA
jgi:hypothetical protein